MPGERNINVANLTSMTNGRGESQRSGSSKAKQIPSTEFRSALSSLEMYTGPRPGRRGRQPHVKSDFTPDKR